MVSVSACSPYGSLQGRVSGISWRTGVQVLVSWQFLGGGESCQSGKISFTVSQSLYPGPVGCVGGRIRGILAANLRGAQLEKERTLLSIRKEAYNDFFSGQVAYHNNETAKYQLLVQNARFAIGVYSTKPTVEALAAYFECVDLSDCRDSPKNGCLTSRSTSRCGGNSTKTKSGRSISVSGTRYLERTTVSESTTRQCCG
jgi:hypothetical protein